MTKTKEILIEFLRIFYGELFNSKNNFVLRIKRIIARFKVSRLFVFLIRILNKNRKIETFPTVFKNIDVERASKELNDEGIFKDIQLPYEYIEKILSYCEKKQFNFNRNQNHKIHFNERMNQKNLYIMNLMNPHLECEIIDKIFRDEKIISIVKRYLGVTPKINSTQIFWSIPCFDENGKPVDTPNKEFGYHYDVDGFKFLKLFFYLTDVNDKYSGSHVFIKKNKKDKLFKERIFRRISDERAEKYYKNRIHNVTGKKGTGFMEDTSFYHKGNFPFKERGIIACIYNVSDW